jgi:hypothetical protein
MTTIIAIRFISHVGCYVLVVLIRLRVDNEGTERVAGPVLLIFLQSLGVQLYS